MKYLLKSIILLMLCFMGTEAYSQVVPPAPAPNEGAPIDGLSTVLLIVGTTYGIKKLRKSNP